MKRLEVGVSGFFIGLPPYDTSVTRAKYKVEEMVTHSKLTRDKLFVLEDVYEAYGLTVNDMNQDIEKGIEIVTIITESGQTVSLPEDKLKLVTEQSIPYYSFGLGVKLGPLPKDLDFTELNDEVKSLVLAKLGVIVTPEIVVLSAETYLTEQEHSTQLVIRDVNSISQDTKEDTIQAQQLEIESLKVRISQLMGCING